MVGVGCCWPDCARVCRVSAGQSTRRSILVISRTADGVIPYTYVQPLYSTLREPKPNGFNPDIYCWWVWCWVDIAWRRGPHCGRDLAQFASQVAASCSTIKAREISTLCHTQGTTMYAHATSSKSYLTEPTTAGRAWPHQADWFGTQRARRRCPQSRCDVWTFSVWACAGWLVLPGHWTFRRHMQ